MLQPLVIGPQPLGHGLHRLPLAIEHQPAHIHPGGGDTVLTRQRRKHLTDKRIQQRIDPGQLSMIHAQHRLENHHDTRARHTDLTKSY
ncbi:hypothetical protein ACFXG4_43455 [Nocardia sp. NPDC059246]|uniref:hypothetical protein n=1 Tax=Nocardia sp. NPDC059246 TaxID=3346789 RepID=UPI0036D0AF0A